MSTPSNLYAEKVFAEHPLGLWPFDDKVDYISVVSESDRDMETWTKSSSATVENIASITKPLKDTYASKVVLPAPGSGVPTATATFTSPNIENLNVLSQSLQSFTISTYFFRTSSYIKSVDIGYTYVDPTSSLDVVETQNFIVGASEWALLTKTFIVPNKNAQFKLIFKVNYVNANDSGVEYTGIFNGITVGQWSEEFSATSLGSSTSAIPSTIALSNISVIPAAQYGISSDSGYYLASNYNIYGSNYGVPIVYGASTVTTLRTNASGPSVIVPGYGFLNNTGRYKDLSLEFWIKINAGSASEQRIVGPIASTDGLYVNREFLMLKIGDTYASHFVGEWGRPMLLNIVVSDGLAKLMINGEDVISLTIVNADLDLPEKTLEGKDQDWIGFYTNDDMSPVQIDCVAIYPYLVSETVAKRRFSYGQAVEFPDNISSSYSTASVFIDYPYADYSNNFNYPQTAGWNSGITDNLKLSSIIELPEYSLPTVSFNNRTTDIWEQDLGIAQTSPSKFISLRPNSSWDLTNGYIHFSRFENMYKPMSAFYGVFVRPETISSDQTLFRVTDRFSSNYFEIVLKTSGKVNYRLVYNNINNEFYESSTYASGDTFVAGINIDVFSKYFGGSLALFFGTKTNLNIYVGGTKEFSGTFSGKIKKVSLLTQQSYSEVSTLFLSSGVASSTSLELKRSSYDLVLKQLAGKHRLDVAVKSYWQDYAPLSHFAKYVTDENGDAYYSFDFIQFNIRYPEVNNFETISGTDYYATTSSSLRTYVTFQSLDEVANTPTQNFTEVRASRFGVVEPTSGWETKKYEVVNGSIIYPPSGIDISKIAISIHLEFDVDGINANPIKIKSLQLASKALNNSSANPINTKFGIEIVPSVKVGIYQDYKKRNPFRIYKGSTPYLYLTNHSGIKLVGEEQTSLSRALSIRLNQGKASSYNIAAMQFMTRFPDKLFPSTPTEVFEIESNNYFIKFYLVATDSSRRRGRIYGIDTETGKEQEGLAFYVNGLLVNDVILNIQEWAIVGIQFAENLDFSNVYGAFRITGPLSMDNISHYQYTALQKDQEVKTRPWLEVLNGSTGTIDWSYWSTAIVSNFKWKNVLYVLAATKNTIDLSQIFKVYTGTNKFIVTDSSVFKLKSYQYSIYQNISWQSQVITPA